MDPASILQSQDIAIAIDPTSKMICHYSSPEDRFIHNALDMFRFHTAIPDPLARQRVRLPRSPHRPLRGNVYNDVASIFVPPNMTDQSNIGMIWRINGGAIAARGREPLRLQRPLKLAFEYRGHNAAAHITPSMPAYQYSGRVLYVDDSVESGCEFRGANHVRSLFLGERRMHIVQPIGEEKRAHKCGQVGGFRRRCKFHGY